MRKKTLTGTFLSTALLFLLGVSILFYTQLRLYEQHVSLYQAQKHYYTAKALDKVAQGMQISEAQTLFFDRGTVTRYKDHDLVELKTGQSYMMWFADE
ncbi:hypothetical protein [Ligilactobacillus faecis]|uniref:Competence protein ComG n=1 Tax=Ligilactobacillus faecis TaxID=762833 RepID=A0ABV4DNT1_9LACO|nr:hypothetical protein [Ligilactobacillus faecis]WGN89643.1 hypothetical protein QFX10_00730 [Ligilactobacillus faecis]